MSTIFVYSFLIWIHVCYGFLIWVVFNIILQSRPLLFSICNLYIVNRLIFLVCKFQFCSSFYTIGYVGNGMVTFLHLQSRPWWGHFYVQPCEPMVLFNCNVRVKLCFPYHFKWWRKTRLWKAENTGKSCCLVQLPGKRPFCFFHWQSVWFSDGALSV